MWCAQGGGSNSLFIARWDRRALQDQTDLTKGQDDSLEAVEEASRRGPATLRVSSRVFPRHIRDVFRGDKFRVYFALESLFSAFMKFTLENIEYAKLVEIVS